jgi:hypothetical protein
MDRIFGFGFMALFIASIWIIAMLWAIYKVLVAILDELRGTNKSDNPNE